MRLSVVMLFLTLVSLFSFVGVLGEQDSKKQKNLVLFYSVSIIFLVILVITDAYFIR